LGSGDLPLSLWSMFLTLFLVSLEAHGRTGHRGVAWYVQPDISPPPAVASSAPSSSNLPFAMPERDHCRTLPNGYQRAIGADRINDHWKSPNREACAEPPRTDGRRISSGRMSRIRPEGGATVLGDFKRPHVQECSLAPRDVNMLGNFNRGYFMRRFLNFSATYQAIRSTFYRVTVMDMRGSAMSTRERAKPSCSEKSQRLEKLIICCWNLNSTGINYIRK